MPFLRLNDQQKELASREINLAKKMARRFKPLYGMDYDEWLSEVLLVFVESIATAKNNPNFEAHFYTRCRFRRMQLAQKAKPFVTAAVEFIPAPLADNLLDQVLEEFHGKEKNIIRLRLAGGDWETIGKAYGVCGRTIRRWHGAAINRLSKRGRVLD